MTDVQKKTISIGVAIVAVLTIGLGFFVIRPQLADRSADAAKAEELTAAGTAAQENAALLKTKADSIDAAVSDVNRLTSQFPNEVDQEAWFDLLFRIANEEGVTIKSITPSVPVDPSVLGTDVVDPSSIGAPDPNAAPVDPSAAPAQSEAPEMETILAPDGTEIQVPVRDGSTAPAPAPDEASTPVGEFPIAASQVTLTVSGERAQTIAFLRRVEGLDQPVSVRSVSFEAGEVSIVGRTYLTRPLEVPAEFANGGQPQAPTG